MTRPEVNESPPSSLRNHAVDQPRRPVRAASAARQHSHSQARSITAMSGLLNTETFEAQRYCGGGSHRAVSLGSRYSSRSACSATDRTSPRFGAGAQPRQEQPPRRQMRLESPVMLDDDSGRNGIALPPLTLLASTNGGFRSKLDNQPFDMTVDNSDRSGGICRDRWRNMHGSADCALR